jgi:hypothetical protein
MSVVVLTIGSPALTVRAEVSKSGIVPAWVIFAKCGWPGMARRPVTFFCFAKRKSPKKRRPAVWVPCASLRGNLRCSTAAGSRANSPSAQTSAIPDPPPSALLGPARTGQAGAATTTNRNTPWRVPVSSGIQYWYSAVRYSCPHPLWMRRGAEVQTDQGKNLFERSELFLTPAGPSTAGCPQRSGGTQQPGSPFLLLTFLLAKQKKSELPPGNPGQQASENPAWPDQEQGFDRHSPNRSRHRSKNQ